MKMRAPGSQPVAQTVWMLILPNPKLGASSGCGIRAAAKIPPHPAAPEPGKSLTHWTRGWSWRKAAIQQPAPPTQPRHPSDPMGMASLQRFLASILLAAHQHWLLPHAMVMVRPQCGQPTGTLGHGFPAWISTSRHLCPSATLSLCPWLNLWGSPLLCACSSAPWGSAPSSHPLVPPSTKHLSQILPCEGILMGFIPAM